MRSLQLKKIYIFAKENFPITLTICFVVVGIFGIFAHELWRDETQAWLFARDSSGLLDLLKNLRYEGHPPLWHVSLFFASRIIDSPVIMQFMHLAIAALTVYLFARFAPFKKLHKVLFSFSYFMLYEYAILSRNYSLGILFGVIFCVLYTRKQRNFLQIGIVLFLMSQTSVMGALLAVILGGYVGVDFLLQKKRTISDWKRISLGLSIAATGVLLFFLQTRVPADGAYSTFRIIDIRYVLSLLWQSFVPIPARAVSYWNTNLLPNQDLATLFSIGLLFVTGLYFKRKLKFLLLYLSGLAVFLSFFYFMNFGGLRHHGYIFIFFLLCVWLMNAEERRPKQDSFWHFQNILLTVLLSVQVLGAAAALYKETRLTFSRSEAAASYIQEQQLDTLPIVGVVDYQTSALLGFLHKDAYYLQSERQGSFIIWDERRLQTMTDEQVLAKTKQYAREQNTDVLLVSNRDLSAQGLQLKEKFTDNAVIVDELYFLYIVSP